MRKVKGSNIALIVVNVVMLLIMVLTVPVYVNFGRNMTLQKNIEAVSNETESVANSVNLYFYQQHSALVDKKKFLESGEKLSIEETMSYLGKSNSSPEVMYQMVYGTEGNEYLCYSAGTDGEITQIKYNIPSYVGSLEPVVERVGAGDYSDSVINTSGAFINTVNAKRSVAFFTGINVAAEDGGDLPCVLLEVVAVDDLFGTGLPLISYDDADGAIVDGDGEYIAKTSEFRSNSIYEHLVSAYLSKYSEAMEYKTMMTAEGKGSFTLTDLSGESHLFCFCTVSDSDNWLYISKMPSGLLEYSNIDGLFTGLMISFLLILILIDGLYVFALNKNLKKNLHDIEVAVKNAESANLAKSSFLSRITHEIRTPLNAIIGYMTIAKSVPDDIRRSQDCVNKTEIAAKHLLTIINDVLDVSAIESGKFKIVNDSFNFKSLITAITVMFYSLSQNSGVFFDVIFENAVDETMVGDQMRINQILINLLNNAVKFTKSGGSVHLLIRQTEVDENTIKIRFTVSDTGIGMSSEYVSRIWEPFEQADSTISRKYGGTGLGLAITKTLTDMMAGTIDVESELNVGTSFVVELPLGKVEQTHYSEHYNFSSIHALVVDDDKDTCEYVKLLMNRYSVRCSMCFSGEEAIRVVAGAQIADDKYNLCLIDMKMPGMNGIETAKAIREKYDNDMPVVILSAYDFAEYAAEAAEVGITHFVAKPLFQSTLFDLLVDYKEHYANDGAVQESQDNAGQEDYSSISILLAEDNEMNMEIAVELLKMTGAKVESVWNGQQACDKFINSQQGTYDVILMDVQMPEMDGYAATRVIRSSEHPDAATIPIVAMTANAFEEDIENSLKAGMNDHISKPIDHERLFEIVGRLGRRNKNRQ